MVRRDSAFALIGAAARYLAILLAFANTRLFASLLGVRGFAAYAIALSISGWLVLLNLGLPNTLQNRLSEYRVRNGDPGPLLRAAAAIALVVIAAVVPILGALAALVKYSLLRDYSGFSIGALWLFFAISSLAPINTIINQCLLGLKRSIWPNIAPAVIAGATTVGLLLLKAAGVSGVDGVLVVSSAPHLLTFVIGVAILGGYVRPEFDRTAMFSLVRDSREMLLFSVLTLLTLSIDYIVMSRVVSAGSIVAYNIEMRLFGALLVGYAAVLANLWTVFLDHIKAGEIANARRRLRTALLTGGAVVGVGSGVLITWNDRLIGVLSAGSITSIPTESLLIYTGYIFVRIWSDTYSVALLAINETRTVLLSITCQSVISIVGQLLLGPRLGTNGIILSLALSFLVTSVWIYPRKLFQHLHRLNTAERGFRIGQEIAEVKSL